MRLLQLLTSALILALAPVVVTSQGPVPFEGRLVQEASGEPIAGATIAIVGLSGSASSDRDGRFTWAPAPQPPFQVIVILPGGQVARPVLVDRLPSGIVSIEVGAIQGDAVTVIGAAPSVDATPGSATTLLSGAQVAARQPENVMQAIETVPGVSQVSEGHAAVPAVRGLARGRTLFLIDGGRVTSERRAGPSATFLDPSVIEGVEVARGPGSVAYGSDALGGVISIRTRRPEFGAPLSARVVGSFGAGVPEQSGSVELSKGLAHGGVLVNAHVRHAGDYDSPDGEVFNSSWEDRGFLLHAGQVVGAGLLAASWQSDFGRDAGRPRSNSRTVRFSYPFENSHRLTASYDRPGALGFSTLALTGFWGAHEQRTEQDRAATGTAGRRVERADVSAHDFHLKGSAKRAVGPGRLEVGIDANGRYGLEALDIIHEHALAGPGVHEIRSVSVDRARRLNLGAYLEAESAVGAFARISGGLRADRVTTRNTGGHFGDRATAQGAASGFGALTLGPFRGLSLTTQLARGFRDPTLSDRYYRGPTGRGFVTGNPDLVPERSLQFDVAARYTTGGLQLALYGYDYRIRDLVERYEAGADTFFFRNRGRARLRGIEAEAQAELGRGYSFTIAAHRARGRAVGEEAPLDDISPDTVTLLGRRDFARGYAQMRVALQAPDDRPGPSETAMPGATIVDLGAGYRVAPQVELRSVLRNLLNDEYSASPDPRFVLAPGRSGSVTVAVEF